MGDWNISRKRFYGLPLPFYPCPCGELTVAGSREELRSLAGEAVDSLKELHRPWIDEIEITCPRCGKRVKRIPDTGDVWLDAGIVPYSTLGYFSDRQAWEKNFPAEWIVENHEQVRLWFYAMLFMSVVLEDRPPYERAMCHGTVLREDGGKFSKTGYMIQFDEAAEEIGSDSVRYLYAGNPVPSDVRFGFTLGDEARRKLLGFRNIFTFFDTYYQIDKPDLSDFQPEDLCALDTWLLLRTNQFIESATKLMDNYKAFTLVKEFEDYVEDVSNWYIRLNRRRFWKAGDAQDKRAAYYSLYFALKSAAQVMSPVIPFQTEAIWQKLVRAIEPDAAISIHLSEWPEPRPVTRFTINTFEKRFATAREIADQINKLVDPATEKAIQSAIEMADQANKLVDPAMERAIQSAIEMADQANKLVDPAMERAIQSTIEMTDQANQVMKLVEPATKLMENIEKRTVEVEEALQMENEIASLGNADIFKYVKLIIKDFTFGDGKQFLSLVLEEIKKTDVDTVCSQLREIVEDNLLEQTELVREVIATALRLRNEQQIKVRQPLRTLFIVCDEDAKTALELFEQQVLSELNVKELRFLANAEELQIKFPVLNFKVAGAILKRRVNEFKEFLQADTADIVKQIEQSDEVQVDGWDTFPSSMFILQTKTKPGIVSTTCRGGEITVALDIELTDELRREGAVRDVIRQIQTLRKEAGYAVEQRIKLHLATQNKFLEQAIQHVREHIKSEVLADDFDFESADLQQLREQFQQKAKAAEPFDISREIEIAGAKILLEIAKSFSIKN